MKLGRRRNYWHSIIQFILDGFGWVLLSYLILVCIYIFCFLIRRTDTITYLDKLFGVGFGLSFSASFLEDICVFFLLGSIVAVVSIRISQKRPESYNYITRIGALLNSDEAFLDDQLIAFVDKELKGLLGFNKEMTAKICLQEYMYDKKAYKIYTELKHHIANACRDILYKPFTPPRVKVYSDLEFDGNWGYIKQLRTYNIVSSSTIHPYIEGDIKPLKNADYDENIDLDIPGNGAIGWEVFYGIWHITEKEGQIERYTVSVSRYTRSIKLHIENNLSLQSTIKFDLRIFRHKDNKSEPYGEKCELNKHVKSITIDFKDIRLYPLDMIEVYFHPPETVEQKLISKI